MPTELKCFDPLDGKFFVTVSADSRVRLWDAASENLRQQYVEPKHLSKKFTCISWYRPVSRHPSNRLSDEHDARVVDLGLIALGTTDGSISVWDLQRGILQCTLLDKDSTHKISDLTFSKSGTRLFTCSEKDKHVHEWCLRTGKILRKLKGINHGCSKICLSPKGDELAVAGTSIKILKLFDGKSSRKLAVGQGTVSTLAFSLDGKFLLSGSRGTRFISLFSGEKIDDNIEPRIVFPLHDTLVHFGVHSSASTDDGPLKDCSTLTVVATCTGGGCFLLQARFLNGTVYGTQGIQTCEVKGESENPQCLQAFLMPLSPSASTVVIAHGNPTAPRFESVQFVDQSGNFLRTVQLLKSRYTSASSMNVVRTAAALTASGKTSAPVEISEGAYIGAFEESGEIFNQTDMISSETKSLVKRPRSDSIAERNCEGNERTGENKGLMKICSILDAHLATLNYTEASTDMDEDQTMLSDYLKLADSDQISKAVDMLSSESAVELFLMLTEYLILNSRVRYNACLLLESLLSIHSEALMCDSDIEAAVTSIQKSIDVRVARYPTLLELSGKIDFILNQSFFVEPFNHIVAMNGNSLDGKIEVGKHEINTK